MYAKEADTSCRHIKQAKEDCDAYDRLMDNYCREDGTCNIGEKVKKTGEKTVCKPPQQVYCAREYFDAVSCIHSLLSFTKIEAQRLIFISREKQRSLAHMTQGVIINVSINMEVDGSQREKFSLTEFSTPT